MEALYQGKVDNFCAIYAVLNALRISHEINVYAARDFFNAVLMDVARDPAQFRAVLEHDTDYGWLVDKMLDRACANYKLKVLRPYTEAVALPEEVWACLRQWLSRPGHAAVLRFCRFMPLQDKPVVDHWSTACRMDHEGIHLLDASHEATAVHMLPFNRTFVWQSLKAQESFWLPPESVRLVGRA